jgi:hypothetical protein
VFIKCRGFLPEIVAVFVRDSVTFERLARKFCHFILQAIRMISTSGYEPEQAGADFSDFDLLDEAYCCGIGDGDPMDLLPDTYDEPGWSTATSQDTVVEPALPTSETRSATEIPSEPSAPAQLDLEEPRSLLASARSQVHSGAGSIIDDFRHMIGGRPTRQALSSLRELFPCTGPITRNQRRSWDEMAAAFEGCGSSIREALKTPAVSREVVRRLVNGSQSARDREQRLINAAIFLLIPRV